MAQVFFYKKTDAGEQQAHFVYWRRASSKNLASLELVRLANNDLQALPDEVLRAPRLAWVALAGNPRLVGFGQLGSALETTMAQIDFSDAVALGKGASEV